MKAAVFGTISMDLIFNVEKLPGNNTRSIFSSSYTEMQGGAAANVCAYLTGTLGIQSCIISAVGEDDTGYKLINGMEKLGVDTAGIVRYTDSTSTRIATLKDKQGERLFIVNPGAIERLQNDHIKTEILDLCAFLYVAPNKRDDLSELLIKQFKKSNKPIAFNPGPAYLTSEEKRNRAKEFFKLVNYVFLNKSEAMEYSGETDLDKAIEALLSIGVKCLIVTCDKCGAILVSREKRLSTSGIDVNVIDPNGAGDAFAAGFVGMLLSSNDFKRALEFANALGAFKVQNLGLREVIPQENEIWGLINRDNDDTYY